MDSVPPISFMCTHESMYFLKTLMVGTLSFLGVLRVERVRFSHGWGEVNRVAYINFLFQLPGQSFVLETRENVAAVPSALSALRSFVLLIHRCSLGHIAFVESLSYKDINKNQSGLYKGTGQSRFNCFI